MWRGPGGLGGWKLLEVGGVLHNAAGCSYRQWQVRLSAVFTILCRRRRSGVLQLPDGDGTGQNTSDAASAEHAEDGREDFAVSAVSAFFPRRCFRLLHQARLDFYSFILIHLGILISISYILCKLLILCHMCWCQNALVKKIFDLSETFSWWNKDEKKNKIIWILLKRLDNSLQRIWVVFSSLAPPQLWDVTLCCY